MSASITSITKNDNALAAANNAPKRLAILQAIEAAQGKARESMLDGLRMTANYGATSTEEVSKGWPSCNNPGVYAPNFNRGYKASQIIGIKETLRLIDDAAKKPGTAFDTAKAALKLVMDEGAKRAKNGDKGMVPAGAAKKLVNASLTAAGRTLAQAKANGGKGKGGGKDGGGKITVEDGVAAFVADYMALMIRAKKIGAPEGREKAWNEGINDARKALENLSLCVKLASK